MANPTMSTWNANGTTFDILDKNAEAHAVKTGNVHGLTLADIGAAPAGYGLGGSGISVNDLNEALKCGFFAWGSNCANAPFDYGMGITINRFDGRYTQLLFNPWMSGCGEIVVRHFDGTEWLPDEWINPPMLPGVEYRTTERWNGRPVYTKAVNCGALGQNTADDIAHNTANIEVVWVSGGYWFDGGTRFSIPYFGGGDDNHILVSAYGGVIHRAHKGSVYNVLDMTVAIKYTKSAD